MYPVDISRPDQPYLLIPLSPAWGPDAGNRPRSCHHSTRCGGNPARHFARNQPVDFCHGRHGGNNLRRMPAPIHLGNLAHGACQQSVPVVWPMIAQLRPPFMMLMPQPILSVPHPVQQPRNRAFVTPSCIANAGQHEGQYINNTLYQSRRAHKETLTKLYIAPLPKEQMLTEENISRKNMMEKNGYQMEQQRDISEERNFHSLKTGL